MTTLVLPELPYALDALAPYMSAETLEFHHSKHHKAYVDKGNELLAKSPFQDQTVEEIIRQTYGNDDMRPLFNNVAQHWNHIQFWQMMKPSGGGKIPGKLEAQIIQDLGSVEAFNEKFVADGVAQFGSGWVWLVHCPKHGKLEIVKTPNGENPLVHNKITLLGCDVWEHSYYIDYRNKRPDYIKAFLANMVNWEYVEHLYSQGINATAA